MFLRGWGAEHCPQRKKQKKASGGGKCHTSRRKDRLTALSVNIHESEKKIKIEWKGVSSLEKTSGVAACARCHTDAIKKEREETEGVKRFRGVLVGQTLKKKGGGDTSVSKPNHARPEVRKGTPEALGLEKKEAPTTTAHRESGVGGDNREPALNALTGATKLKEKSGIEAQG